MAEIDTLSFGLAITITQSKGKGARVFAILRQKHLTSTRERWPLTSRDDARLKQNGYIIPPDAAFLCDSLPILFMSVFNQRNKLHKLKIFA